MPRSESAATAVTHLMPRLARVIPEVALDRAFAQDARILKRKLDKSSVILSLSKDQFGPALETAASHPD